MVIIWLYMAQIQTAMDWPTYIYKIDDVNSTLTLKQTITGLDSMSLNSGTYFIYGQVKFISNTELIIPLKLSGSTTILKIYKKW